MIELRAGYVSQSYLRSARQTCMKQPEVLGGGVGWVILHSQLAGTGLFAKVMKQDA